MTSSARATYRWDMSHQIAPVPGFPGYEVSTDGVLYGPRGRMNFKACPDGQMRVGLRRDRKRHLKYLHQLVWAAHVGSVPPGHTLWHRDGDRGNARLDNLAALARDELSAVAPDGTRFTPTANSPRGRRPVVATDPRDPFFRREFASRSAAAEWATGNPSAGTVINHAVRTGHRYQGYQWRSI